MADMILRNAYTVSKRYTKSGNPRYVISGYTDLGNAVTVHHVESYELDVDSYYKSILLFDVGHRYGKLTARSAKILEKT